MKGGSGDLLSVLRSSMVYSMERYTKLLESMGEHDYINDDRLLLILDDFMDVAARSGVDVKIATCDYGKDALGRNALKLRDNVVELQSGGVYDINVKAPKKTKKATKVDEGEDIG